MDTDNFKADSPFMKQRFCAADVVALRLVQGAMQGNLQYIRELLDRCDGLPQAWLPEQKPPDQLPSTTIRVIYEDSSPQQEQQKQIDMVTTTPLLPGETK
jgi:hypothetical protein